MVCHTRTIAETLIQCIICKCGHEGAVIFSECDEAFRPPLEGTALQALAETLLQYEITKKYLKAYWPR